MGVMLQEGGIYPSARPIDVVRQFCGLYGNGKTQHANPQELIDLVGLTERQKTSWRRLSGGEKQRLSLALALASQPRIIFLDEPSAGLDPVTSADLDALIVALNHMLGTTFVIISHELASIFAIGHRFAMLDGARKRLVALGPPAELRDHSPDEWVRRFLSRVPSSET
jgi:phospholipid/cholesterol/gamma-HCH transport system ATP-binding protein